LTDRAKAPLTETVAVNGSIIRHKTSDGLVQPTALAFPRRDHARHETTGRRLGFACERL